MRIYITLFVILLSVAKLSAQRTVGLLTHDHQSEDGYVLFPPLSSKTTYLLDKCGRQIRNWVSSYQAGNCAYLLPDGSLIRAGNAGNTVFATGPAGGVIEIFDWNGSLKWTYTLSDNLQCQHHDLTVLPNGHILAIAWEYKTRAEALAVGRESSRLGGSLWSEKIVELEPFAGDSARIVWEWKAWDHLIQNVDPSKPGYDSIRNHPERININFSSPNLMNPDWIHLNGIAYNADLDQIVVSSYFMSEIWIIDHSTTTAEAAGRTGGLRKKGGDLLYRWGNPQTYKVGSAADQKLYGVHAPYWIENGQKGAGGIMLFNNGQGRPDGDYSSVEILYPAIDSTGSYPWTPRTIFGPATSQLVYSALNKVDFYSAIISNAQRLPGGNTLICEGAKGYLFEVDSSGNTVWAYENPDAALVGPVKQGDVPSQNNVFKCVQYSQSYPAFAGRTLIPGAPVELNPGTYDCYFQTPTSVAGSSLFNASWKVENPFSEALRVRYTGTERNVRLMLFNSIGQLCGSWTTSFTGQELKSLEPAAALLPGLYLLEITDDSGHRQVVKLQHP